MHSWPELARNTPLRSLGFSLLSILSATGCGAKTGLWEPDTSIDARTDARSDASIDTRSDVSIDTPVDAPRDVPIDLVIPPCSTEPRMPRIELVPQSPMRIAVDPAFQPSRSFIEGATSLLTLSAPNDDVAAIVVDMPAITNLASFANAVETRLTTVFGASPVLVGTAGITPDGFFTRRSTFRVTTLTPTTAEALRDQFGREVAPSYTSSATAGFLTTQTFVLEINTLVRSRDNRGTILFAVAPEVRFDDAASETSLRLLDFTGATGLVRGTQRLALECHLFPGMRSPTADFLWLVDTSSSMNDDQERLGNTAQLFFQRMTAAGIDFRVGVLQGGARGPVNLDNPGFSWILGSAPNGPQQLAYQVTYRRYRNETTDNVAPYPILGGQEEPVAAAILVGTEMERRANTDSNDNRRFRAGAQRVAFFATDERGVNDDSRFFALNTALWGSTPDVRVMNATQWFRSHGFLTFGLANVFAAGRCPVIEDLIPCLTAANGGAYIPITTALDREINAAFERIVNAVAGVTSGRVLPRVPVSSSLFLRTGTVSVPRSRSAGFDYDAPSRAIVFNGMAFQPPEGVPIHVSYYAWQN